MSGTNTSARGRRTALAVLLAVGLTAAACGDDDDDGQAAPSSTAGSSTTAGGGGGSTTTAAEPEEEFCTEERKGGSITVGTPALPTTLDPYIDGGGNILSGFSQVDRNQATLKVLVRPLVIWMWIGGFVIAFGTLICISPIGKKAAAAPCDF